MEKNGRSYSDGLPERVLGYGYQHKVGDLDAWGVQLPRDRRFPRQDSATQVTAAAFAGCNTTDPILNLNDGNSLFNLTSSGRFYFIGGASGHREKNQKLRVWIGSGSAEDGTGILPADDISPSSYPMVFGSIPVANSSASSSASSLFPGFVAFAAIVAGTMAVI